MNLVLKLISTVVEYIVLSFDTPYYTELPPYSPKTEIENRVNMGQRSGCSLYDKSTTLLKKLKCRIPSMLTKICTEG